MNFSIAKQSLLKALQKVQSVVPSHTTQAIFYNILIDCEKDKLSLTATDGNMTIKCNVKADVKKKGRSTLSGRHLFNIVREFPEQNIDVEVDDKDVFSVRCGSASCKIYGLSADSFPDLPEFDGDQAIAIEMRVLREMLKKTIYAASIEGNRDILNGVLLSMKDQKITVVATDGRRLALVEQEVELAENSGKEVILPLKAVAELIKCLEEEGTVSLQLDQKKAGFDTGEVKLISNLVEGIYPNYRQVIPTQSEERITIGRETLLAALRRVAIFTESRSPRVKITFGDNQIQISGGSVNIGEANESVAIKYAGKTINVAFNPEFLMDPLRNLVEDEVFIELSDDLSPLVIKSNIPFLYVLMPLRGE